MDYDSVAKAGSMLGSGGMVNHGRKHLHGGHGTPDHHFYAHESCGVHPLPEGRLGCARRWSGFMPEGRPEDIDLIADWQKTCGPHVLPAGRSAAMPRSAS